jgi:diaminopimelate decarboxylase
MPAHPAGPRHAEVFAEEHPLGAPPDTEHLHALDPAIWSVGIGRDATSGALTLHGHDARDLARDFGTPAMLLDVDDVRSRAAAFRSSFSDGDVYYAAKAFTSSAMVRWVDEAGLGLDVCTGGELAVALRAGFDPQRLILHGNNKSLAEIEAAMDAGVSRIVVDSFEEIVRVAAAALERNITQQVLVRVTVGVEAHTHEFIATAHEDQKFGFSLAGGDALEAVRRIVKLPSLALVGLHSHIGSQIFDTSGFEVAAHRVVGLLATIRDELELELGELDLGGGLGIAYVSGDDPEPLDEVAARLRAIVQRETHASGLVMPRIAVEPGRAIVGPSGITLYEVGTVKNVDGIRTYVSVDGGMSDNIRTSLYDADWTVVLASRVSTAPPMLARVVGKHCESGDVIVKDCWLPSDVTATDLLAVAATGAYCRSMASNYNLVARPPVVAIESGAKPRVIVRRETIEDVLATDMPL